MPSISRRKLAENAAERIVGGEAKKNVLRELAAYLIDAHRQKEAELIVRDIETALTARGFIVATVVSARKLSSEALVSVEAFIRSRYDNVKQVTLHEEQDESVIGGVLVQLPDSNMDATVRYKLEKLTV